ncbi:hypothetical protein K4F52_004597 [Lecanicillium sp. MT-2017a]|nr:hypothetical protein K4F52_004597 [Lecanicillium sp. MT-2017a]
MPVADAPQELLLTSLLSSDDIIDYVGPSLERHRGCDLVDLNPGAGVWSQALHRFLEPRKHIMMERDADLYQPFLKELLAKPSVEMINKSGVVWKELFEMMRTSLSQDEASREETPQRNDTLLVTANLSMYPKKAFRSFDSVSTMVLYQFMSSIRHTSLFQRYGLVRMLIWVNDDDKKRLLPRSLARRKRGAFEAEISCDWVHEICGKDLETEDRMALRDEWMNLESAYDTAARMEEMGLKMPTGRETIMHRKIKSDPSLQGQQLAGKHPPSLARPFKQELEDLEAEQPKATRRSRTTKNADLPPRLKALRARSKGETALGEQYLGLLQERDNLFALARSGGGRDSAAFRAADAAWHESLDNLNKNQRNEFNMIHDNYHLFRQSPHALLWDRRAYEPLATADTDFYPNAPTALLDIQPKSMRAPFREFGPATSRAGDMSDVMLRFWFSQTLLPVQQAMDSVWAGFGEQFAACPGLTDVGTGGSPVEGRKVGAMRARCVNEAQWAEIMQAWMDWPFRPAYTQMLGRLADESEAEADEEETKSGAVGVMI